MTTGAAPDEVDELADLLAAPPTERTTDDPARRRRVRRAWIIAAATVLVLVGAGGGYVAWALAAPPPSPVSSTRVPTVAPGPVAAPVLPADRAAAVSVTGAADYLGPDGLQLASGSNEPRQIASISKLITALVVLDAHPLADADDPGPTITFSKADHDLYDAYYVRDAIVAEMPTGSSMSLRDALATMLLPSASNYADAVSTWAYGSRSAFLDAAQTWLTAHGLTGTTFVEPTGISERNTSTPADLLALGRLAAANPAIARLASTPAMTVPGAGDLQNTNDLLGQDGITGLKTGNNGPGTFALLYTATLAVGASEPLSVTGISLDGVSRESVDADVTRLLESIRAGFHDVTVARAGTLVGSVETEWGASAQLVLAQDAALLTWSDTPITATLDPQPPASFRDGARAGTATWVAGSQSVSVPVEVRGDIAPPTNEWLLTHPPLPWR